MMDCVISFKSYPLKSECDCLYGGVIENSHTRNLPTLEQAWDSSCNSRNSCKYSFVRDIKPDQIQVGTGRLWLRQCTKGLGQLIFSCIHTNSMTSFGICANKLLYLIKEKFIIFTMVFFFFLLVEWVFFNHFLKNSFRTRYFRSWRWRQLIFTQRKMNTMLQMFEDLQEIINTLTFNP